MRITFVLPYAGLAGGIRVVAIYAERLQKRGHEVTVVSTPQKQPPLKRKIKSLLKGQGWPVLRKGPSHFDGLNVKHIVIDKARPIVEEDVPDADAVIATWWETAEWISEFHSCKGKKYYFIQGYDVREGLPSDRVKATYKLPLKKITISQWLLNIMRHEYGDSDVRLVANSVDTTIFNAVQRLRQELPTLGFMYSMENFKGCDIILDALKIVQRKIPNLRVLAFGACPESLRLPLPPKTEYYYQPSQNKIREIYASCDFWLFGSRAEGFGLPILEAMACRTPVIATPAGAAPELVSSGGGVLLEQKSVEAMVDAVIGCYDISAVEWEIMSKNAHKTAVSYTWDDATDSFEGALFDKQKTTISKE